MELSAQREIAVITTVQLHCLAFRTANTDYALMGCPPTVARIASDRGQIVHASTQNGPDHLGSRGIMQAPRTRV